MILTASVKGAREGARVKIVLVGRPQTAGRASRSGAGLIIERRGENRRSGEGLIIGRTAFLDSLPRAKP